MTASVEEPIVKKRGRKRSKKTAQTNDVGVA